MKTQKWMLLASVILFLGAVALVAFTILTPYTWAQGPGGGPMFEHGFGPGAGMGGGRGMMGLGGPENSLISIAAEKLGLTNEELIAELQAGKTIADVAAEKNVAVDTIVDAVLAAHTERLNEQVANGQLTQEEVDNYLSNQRVEVIERLNQSRASQNPAPGAAPNESESN